MGTRVPGYPAGEEGWGGLKKTHTFFSPQPSKSGSESMLAQRAAVGQLVELGHSVFHKFGRLQDEWVCILPIVIHRILTQYQDIQNYKKVRLY